MRLSQLVTESLVRESANFGLDTARFDRLLRRQQRFARPQRARIIASAYAAMGKYELAKAAIVPFLEGRNEGIPMYVLAINIFLASGDDAGARALLERGRLRNGPDRSFDFVEQYINLAEGKLPDTRSKDLLLPRNEATYYIALDAMQRGDLVGLLLHGSAAQFQWQCSQGAGNEARFKETSLLLLAAYRQCLRWSLSGSEWVTIEYPRGSFEAAYLECLQQAFREVADNFQPHGAELLILYRGVFRAQEIYVERELHRRFDVPVLAATQDLMAEGTYMAFFLYHIAALEKDFYPAFKRERVAYDAKASAYFKDNFQRICSGADYQSITAGE